MHITSISVYLCLCMLTCILCTPVHMCIFEFGSLEPRSPSHVLGTCGLCGRELLGWTSSRASPSTLRHRLEQMTDRQTDRMALGLTRPSTYLESTAAPCCWSDWRSRSHSWRACWWVSQGQRSAAGPTWWCWANTCRSPAALPPGPWMDPGTGLGVPSSEGKGGRCWVPGSCGDNLQARAPIRRPPQQPAKPLPDFCTISASS